MDEWGNTIWDKTYGRIQITNDIVGSDDGGFVIAGSQQLSGSADAHIYKLDTKGEVVWERSYGGQGTESAECIETTQDGGYILAGYTTSYGQGGYDVYLVRVDSEGYKVWEEVYGTPHRDKATAITRSDDGGFIIAGTTESLQLDTSFIYVLKINSAGQKIWERSYGTDYTTAHDMAKLPHGTYLIVGTIRPSYDSWGDIWVVWIDESGKQIQETTYGNVTTWSLSIFASEKGAIIAEKNALFKIDEWGKVEWNQEPRHILHSPWFMVYLGVCDGIITASRNTFTANKKDIEKYVCSKCFANHILGMIKESNLRNQGEVIWISQLMDTEPIPIHEVDDDQCYDPIDKKGHIICKEVSIFPRNMALGINGTFAVVGQRVLGYYTISNAATTYIAAFRDPSLIGLCPENHILAAILLMPFCWAWKRTRFWNN
jgi:hypothetical protein